MFKCLERIAAALEDISAQLKAIRAEQADQIRLMKEQAGKAPIGEMMDMVRKITGGRPL